MSDGAIIVLVREGDGEDFYKHNNKAEQYVPTQADMLAEDWVFTE